LSPPPRLSGLTELPKIVLEIALRINSSQVLATTNRQPAPVVQGFIWQSSRAQPGLYSYSTAATRFWHVPGETSAAQALCSFKLGPRSHGGPCKYQPPLLFNQYVSHLPYRRRQIFILQAVVSASGIGSITPNPSLYVTIMTLGKKVCKTATSSGPTPTWDTGYELLVVGLRRLSIFVDTCGSRMVESSSILSFRLKCSRGRLLPVLVVGSVDVRTIDLLHQCSEEQRKSIVS